MGTSVSAAMLLEGRKALVFGGTSGIGLATCQSLLARGVQVVAISRNPREGLPEDLQTAQCDVRDREQMAALFAEQTPFDILVSSHWRRPSSRTISADGSRWLP